MSPSWPTVATVLLLAGCGPVGPLPGGALRGELAPFAGDWSFTDSHRTVQLEVRPENPYSVTVWCVATGGQLYIGAGRGARGRWARILADDPQVHLRVSESLFPGTAVRVHDADEIAVYLSALRRKYASSAAVLDDFGPEGAWLFRIEPRSSHRPLGRSHEP